MYSVQIMFWALWRAWCFHYFNPWKLKFVSIMLNQTPIGSSLQLHITLTEVIICCPKQTNQKKFVLICSYELQVGNIPQWKRHVYVSLPTFFNKCPKQSSKNSRHQAMQRNRHLWVNHANVEPTNVFTPSWVTVRESRGYLQCVYMVKTWDKNIRQTCGMAVVY